jgi:hypothetical protein
MSSQKNQRTNQAPICAECKKRIEVFEKYAKNDKDGTILCKACFDELRKKGVIA